MEALDDSDLSLLKGGHLGSGELRGKAMDEDDDDNEDDEDDDDDDDDIDDLGNG